MRIPLYLILILASLCSIVIGQEDPALIESTEAVRLYNAGKYSEALPIAKDVLAKRKNLLGDDHLLVGNAWRNIAFIELSLANTNGAEKAFDKAIDIYSKKKQLGKTDEITFAGLLENAAYLDVKAGILEKAIGKYKRAVEIRERLDPNSSAVVATLANLGRVYNGLDRYEDASKALVQAFEIESKQSVRRKDFLLLQESAACSLRKLGKAEDADGLEKRFPSLVPETIPRVVGGVVNGKATFLSKPAYPEKAKAARAQGSVTVRILIDEAGKIISACAVSGPAVFWQATEIAAFESKFSPTTLAGQPVKVSGMVVYNFSR